MGCFAEVSLEMHGENKVLIKEDSNTDKFEISLLNARLSLQYFKLETNVRTTWYDLVNSENIRRVLPNSRLRYYIRNNIFFEREFKIKGSIRSLTCWWFGMLHY